MRVNNTSFYNDHFNNISEVNTWPLMSSKSVKTTAVSIFKITILKAICPRSSAPGHLSSQNASIFSNKLQV